MKNLFFSLFFLSFPVFIFSQNKCDKGFVVKMGTFTLPKKTVSVSDVAYAFPAGISSSLGVFVKRHFNSYFGLSAEMIYSYSRYERERIFPEYVFDNRGFTWNKQEQQFSAQSFTLPLVIHLRPGKSSKISLFVGAAANYFILSSQKAIYERDSENVFIEQGGLEIERIKTSFQMLYAVGVQYEIWPHTSVGLEFLGTLNEYPKDSDCFTCDSILRSPFWMKSLAISLRHNILR